MAYADTRDSHPCSRISATATARSFAVCPTSARRRRPGDAVRVVVAVVSWRSSRCTPTTPPPRSGRWPASSGCFPTTPTRSSSSSTTSSRSGRSRSSPSRCCSYAVGAWRATSPTAGALAWVVGRLVAVFVRPDRPRPRVLGDLRPHRRSPLPAGADLDGGRGDHRRVALPRTADASSGAGDRAPARDRDDVPRAGRFPTDVIAAIVLGWGSRRSCT